MGALKKMTTAFHARPCIEWGVASQALPGQSVSGDAYLVESLSDGALVAVVDGLGHGGEATSAALTAVSVLKENAALPVVALVQRCHQALIQTRGVVVTIASFNSFKATLSWLSVGNVAGLLLRADSKAIPPIESAILRGGLVGYQLPPLRASVIPVSTGDLLLLTSDGISSGFEQGVIPADRPQEIADRIMSRYFKGNDDALALVVRYLGIRHE
jgi:phosphoserine phosphatase RsbX